MCDRHHAKCVPPISLSTTILTSLPFYTRLPLHPLRRLSSCATRDALILPAPRADNWIPRAQDPTGDGRLSILLPLPHEFIESLTHPDGPYAIATTPEEGSLAVVPPLPDLSSSPPTHVYAPMPPTNRPCAIDTSNAKTWTIATRPGITTQIYLCTSTASTGFRAPRCA